MGLKYFVSIEKYTINDKDKNDQVDRLTDLGSITLKCNSLHYNYFQSCCIILQLQLLSFFRK